MSSLPFPEFQNSWGTCCIYGNTPVEAVWSSLWLKRSDKFCHLAFVGLWENSLYSCGAGWEFLTFHGVLQSFLQGPDIKQLKRLGTDVHPMENSVHTLIQITLQDYMSEGEEVRGWSWTSCCSVTLAEAIITINSSLATSIHSVENDIKIPQKSKSKKQPDALSKN